MTSTQEVPAAASARTRAMNGVMGSWSPDTSACVFEIHVCVGGEGDDRIDGLLVAGHQCLRFVYVFAGWARKLGKCWKAL